jgi:hypothetical protein
MTSTITSTTALRATAATDVDEGTHGDGIVLGDHDDRATASASASDRNETVDSSNNGESPSPGGLEAAAEEAAAASATAETVVASDPDPEQHDVPLCLQEGLLGVIKPVNWTSSDVVSYLRGILERDARNRGATVGRVGQAQGRRQRRNNGKSKKNTIRVGAYTTTRISLPACSWFLFA